MEITQYTIDAFTREPFHGNPAAICIHNRWLPENTMKAIALENNLSETAFPVKKPKGYHLRWFTPKGEIDLCGHATLASAYVVMNYIEPDLKEVKFMTKSGDIKVIRYEESLYLMTLPAYKLKPVEVTPFMTKAIGVRPVEAYMGRDLVCVYPSSDIVYNAKPDIEAISKLDGLLFHITAKDDDFSCVTRSFAPKCGIKEDPVCGSGHCHVIPYWSERLGKKRLTAYQASERGGVLYCENQKDKVLIGGECVPFAKSTLYL